MGATITLDLKDQYRLAMRLKKSPEVVVSRLNAVMLKVAISMERASKMTVPVRTGRLQSSILTERSNLRYTIAPHTPYAEFVHRRNPYMSRAFNEVEPGARAEIKAAVNDIIKSI